MARPRTPTNILELKGAFKKNPQRRRTGEPQGLGKIGPFRKRPASLKACYSEIVSIAPEGVLTATDSIAVEIAARLLVKVRKNNYRGGELSILIGLLRDMGLTPSGRAKLSVPENKKKNPFDKFDP